MSKQAARESALIRKIRGLPPEKRAAVEDFVEFLAQRDDRELTQAAAKLAEKAFRKVWSNRADAAYDRL
jgi:formate dehydrogenase maturation protein FdhE